jgi:predicted deacetylase
MTPGPARYLLRVDDLCPTVKRGPWLRLAAFIVDLGLRPILAVVPDNRDSGLRVSELDDSFWERMQAMEWAGAAIALHGYQHRAQSRGCSLVPLHRESEFAGVSATTQRTWIRAGLEILRSHGLNPTLWAAPRHGFDGGTLDALRAEGIYVLSDGFARRPFLRGGFTWIPQQLWEPVEKHAGLWTICLHVNTVTAQQFDDFIAFAVEHAAQFTSVDEALAEFPPSRLSLLERLLENAAYARFTGSRFRRGMKRRLHLGRDEESELPLLPPLDIQRPSEFSPRVARDTEIRADRARPRG